MNAARFLTSSPLYIKISINCRFEDLWESTQNPALHEQWDLRFSKISYLPKEPDIDTQKFLYETRIGFGLKISGYGESIANRQTKQNEHYSFLKFYSDSPVSLIKNGSGYWKYRQKPAAFSRRYRLLRIRIRRHQD